MTSSRREAAILAPSPACLASLTTGGLRAARHGAPPWRTATRASSSSARSTTWNASACSHVPRRDGGRPRPRWWRRRTPLPYGARCALWSPTIHASRATPHTRHPGVRRGPSSLKLHSTVVGARPAPCTARSHSGPRMGYCTAQTGGQAELSPTDRICTGFSAMRDLSPPRRSRRAGWRRTRYGAPASSRPPASCICTRAFSPGTWMRVRRRRGGRARRRRAAPCFTRVTSEPRCQARSGCCFCWRSDVRRDCSAAPAFAPARLSIHRASCCHRRD